MAASDEFFAAKENLITGSYPQACSVDACTVTGCPSFEEITENPEAADWQEIVSRVLVTGDARHAFKVNSERRLTHVRLDIFPDCGVARLRLYGTLTDDGLAALRRRWEVTS